MATQAMKAAGLRNLRYIKYDTIDCENGIFDNRNLRFIIAAKTAGYERVYFGSRNLIPMFDKYGDSNWVTKRGWERQQGIQIPTPATMKLKSHIIRTCERELPQFAQHVFSTEGLS